MTSDPLSSRKAEHSDETPRVADLDDKELVSRALDGQEAAYGELLERFRRPVFSLIYRMIGDREQAEDLAQESFVKAFNNLDSYNPNYRFSSWLFKIANNHAIDHLRRARLSTVSIHGSPHAATSEREEETRIVLEAQDESPEQEIMALELGGEIEEAISRLRPEYRTAVILRHIESRPYEEIAEIMDVPIGTVKTFLHRARAELRDALRHLREE
ncbi:MAG: sigma-70 family RNA polymerase sigma factor [Gemmatimonadetes bacterium]|uniref:RNA polymerase sigma factor n=1 Tax=Candidatus Kutchimonas denitrificans TaxID=3056748 RepID=A0AAE4ZCW9_9BACT|nr:sigma-70 family RNA polymerase sigma factor [Gemmatimonadota bacterium]NIR75595.1 sigma-70 family RNA polymerase sigma factor [Candidatus Kutchimonas denitrificans]NIS01909.1 sigma-70 family RNA polymerase sigma factor [Gemmatimonadota bacterium]NIT67690.1 sigma-70 family RNA polymerase sigma factor [Gemmatimonadota bacterium]NIU53564.1 sigma-70 family RNA polymerase sigma factor [Gemmatimonadota bacterium]